MNLHDRKLITIITEASLESLLIEDLKSLGAHGYTIWEARGEGTRGVRSGDWDQSRNICLKVICEEETAQSIAAHLFEHYYSNYAMVIYIVDVQVLRPEKF